MHILLSPASRFKGRDTPNNGGSASRWLDHHKPRRNYNYSQQVLVRDFLGIWQWIGTSSTSNWSTTTFRQNISHIIRPGTGKLGYKSNQQGNLKCHQLITSTQLNRTVWYTRGDLLAPRRNWAAIPCSDLRNTYSLPQSTLSLLPIFSHNTTMQKGSNV